ncbi:MULTISPECIES: hypothetical protein [Paraburkholderia]|uniref:Endonuclease n=1 Tax=Paraburkholderia metrosideri TaxID=580937 RepID=A0ABW9E4B0_9BURK
MRGDEKRVVEAFRTYLLSEGWSVRTEVDHIDVVATRGDHHLYAEAKGRTGRNGPLDVDTMYGQLLRRMSQDEVGLSSFAVVVPEEMARAATRVPARVRGLLNIQIYAVSDTNDVRHIES